MPKKKEETVVAAADRKPGNAYAKQDFHDKDDFQQFYPQGADVTDKFEGKRLEELVKKNAVEIHPEPANGGQGEPVK